MRVRIIRQEGYESSKVKAALGDIIEVGEVTGGKLIAGGTAAPAPPAPVIETVDSIPPQNAAKRTGKVTRKATAPIVPDGEGA